MKALCINCSDSVAEVCVINGTEVLTENITSPHCEKLMVVIDKMLNKTNLNILDLDTLAVVVGPGSFTGIRIAVSTIKGISVVNKNANIISISNFDLISYYVNGLKDYLVVLDSGNEDRYVAHYENNVCTKVMALKNDDILNFNLPIIALKSQKEKLNLNATYLELPSDNLVNIVNKKENKKDFVSINQLCPVYVKLSQAERARSEKILAEMQIVPADNIDDLLEIENKCFKEDAWSRKIFSEEIMLANKYYYLAKFDDKFIAYIGFETNAYDMNLQKIAVLEDYRNCGVATKLFNFSLQQKEKLNKDRYFLEVNVNNLEAINLYKKLGFKIISTRQNYYKNGDACYVMEFQTKKENKSI